MIPTAPTQEVLKWLTNIGSDITEEGSFSRIELWHTQDGENTERLESFDIDKRWSDSFDPADAAQEIFDLAQQDANTRSGGSYRYALVAYRAEQPEYETMCAFRLRAQQSAFDVAGGPSESPTERGIIAQGMRHQEEIFRLQGQLLERATARANMNESVINRMLEQQLKTFELQQKLLDRQQERELKNQQAQHHEERMASLFNAGKVMLPIIAEKLMGGSGKIAAAARYGSPRDQAMKQWLESLSPAQTEKLMTTLVTELNPIQASQFLEVYKSYKEEAEEGTPDYEQDRQLNAAGKTH